MSTLLRQRPALDVSKFSRFEVQSESRCKCPKLARVFPINSPKTLARLSIVRDISANGIGFLLTRSMSPGTLMNVELCGRAIINRVARVVHSTRAEEGWIIGCTLDNPLCDQELREFGS